MVKIGIDIVETERVDKILKKNKYFISGCFSASEIEQLEHKKNIIESIASRFCAKEAFFKCIGTGIRMLKDLKSVSILNLPNGQPIVVLDERLGAEYKNYKFSVSMSHCRKYVCAVVVCDEE